MGELIQILSEEWAIRALIASSLVGIMCGTLGSFIVLRNMSLIGDALAHAILPGIVVSFMVLGYSTIGFFFGSVIAGLITAFFITWLQHNIKTKNDATIGIVFTAMFSLGVIGISSLNSSGGVHLDLKDFLFGSVMGISNEDIWLTGVICVYTILSIIVFYRYLFITTFQPTIAKAMGISVKSIHYYLMFLLSIAIVSALRTVGIILVVAMLITPSATALLLSDKLKKVIILSGFIGFASAVLGLILSIIFDMPPGPAMCVVATVIYLLAGIFAPKKGLLNKYVNKRQQKKRIDLDHIIREVLRDNKTGIQAAALVERTELSKSKIDKHIKELTTEGTLMVSNDRYQLTAKGLEKGNSIVRAHRLWETYLTNEVGLQDGQVHNEADRLEHHLTEEILDEVDHKLGYPGSDPHGAPIPSKVLKPKKALLQLKPKYKGIISNQQINNEIESELWELKLMAGTSFILDQISANSVEITLKNGEKRSIAARLAAQINIA